MTAYWKEVRARARVDVDFYTATKHYGVWHMKVRRRLPDGFVFLGSSTPPGRGR